MMLKLKLQYFGHLMRRVDSLEKTLMLGGIGGRRRRGRQRMRSLDGITNSMDMSLSELRGAGDRQGGLACCNSWGRKTSETTEQLNWTGKLWLIGQIELTTWFCTCKELRVILKNLSDWKIKRRILFLGLRKLYKIQISVPINEVI